MKQRQLAKTVQIALDAERRVTLEDLKTGILWMLGAWVAYFVIINLFIRQLNRIVVPLIDLPLGVLLVAQGAVLLFCGALYLVIRRRNAS